MLIYKGFFHYSQGVITCKNSVRILAVRVLMEGLHYRFLTANYRRGVMSKAISINGLRLSLQNLQKKYIYPAYKFSKGGL